MYRILFTKQAQKDARKLASSLLKIKAEALLDILKHDPFADHPPCEKLLGDLTGAFSRRLKIQHRILYQLPEDEKIVKILRMWTHSE